MNETTLNQQGDRIANAFSAAGQGVSLADLQEMINTLTPMKRLTLSFRFIEGTTDLDKQSWSNVARLAREMERGRFNGRHIVLIGFDGGNGPAEQNKQKALGLTDIIHNALVTRLEKKEVSQVALDKVSFGNAMPLACSNTPWGRRANRRVEVWGALS